jgi:quercetin dioxygenase-like cupin family protein
MNYPSSLAGSIYSVVGDKYVFLVTGAETNGAYAVFEFFIPPGGGSPPHMHTREDEAFAVIDGQFEFHVAGEVQRRGPGEYLFAPRNIPHFFRNAGTTEGRMICTVTPAGLENFFAEFGTRLASRRDAAIPPSPEEIARLKVAAPKYGLELLAPAH